MLCTELFLGLGWTRAAAEKLVASTWWDGQEVGDFTAVQSAEAIIWYRPILDHAIAPMATPVSFVVVALQLLLGLSFLTGRGRPLSFGLGLFLTTNFLLSGVTNPGAFYAVMHIALLLWWIEDQAPSLEIVKHLRVLTLGAAAVALSVVPFIATMSPSRAVDDPALVTLSAFSLLGICTFVVMGRQLAALNTTPAPSPQATAAAARARQLRGRA